MQRQTADWFRVKLPIGFASNCRLAIDMLGGDDLIDEGAATLNKLASILNPEKMRTPSFKMVLTAIGDFAYRREEDGVIVCPIAALRP